MAHFFTAISRPHESDTACCVAALHSTPITTIGCFGFPYEGSTPTEYFMQNGLTGDYTCTGTNGDEIGFAVCCRRTLTVTVDAGGDEEHVLWVYINGVRELTFNKDSATTQVLDFDTDITIDHPVCGNQVIIRLAVSPLSLPGDPEIKVSWTLT